MPDTPTLRPSQVDGIDSKIVGNGSKMPGNELIMNVGLPENVLFSGRIETSSVEFT